MTEVADLSDAAIEFVHGVSVLYFKNNESLKAFKDRYSVLINEWVQPNGESDPLLVLKEPDGASVSVSLKPNNYESHQDVLMIIKNQAMLDIGQPIEAQLNTIMIPHDSQFDTLQTLVDNGVNQIFENILINSEKTDKSVPESLLNAKKRIRDLSLSLQSLGQAIQVPDIDGTINPLIRDIVKKGATADTINDYISATQQSDSTFLNSLQMASNSWIKTVHSMIKIQSDLNKGSALDEVVFWKNYHSALCQLKDKLNCDEIKITIRLLSSAKRFYNPNSLLSDTGLQNRINEAQSFSLFLEGLKISNISTVTSLNELEFIIDTLGSEFKKLRATNYPLDKAVRLIERIDEAIALKISEVTPNLMLLDYSVFTAVSEEICSLLSKWRDKLKEFTVLIRELIRKKAERFVFLRFNCQTDVLQHILTNILSFRAEHQCFVQGLTRLQDTNLLRRIKDINNSIASVNPLICETNIWGGIQQNYIRRISEIEAEVTAVLREELEKCKNSQEMFCVFEKYNTLLKRDGILNAIRQYQHQLLFNVKTDMAQLTTSIPKSITSLAEINLFDVQPTVQKIAWHKRLLNRLTALTTQLVVILGKDWDKTPDGAEISTEYHSLLSALDNQHLFRSWLEEAKQNTFNLQQSVLKVRRLDNGYELTVNFDFSEGALFKSVRNMIWQGFEVPSDLVKLSRISRIMYPHAIIVTEKIETFFFVLNGLNTLPLTYPLAAQRINQIWKMVETFINTSWETIPLQTHTREDAGNDLGLEVFENTLEAVLDDFKVLSCTESELNTLFTELRAFSENEINLNLTGPFQKVADELQLKGFGQSAAFIKVLNARLRRSLTQHLEDAVKRLKDKPLAQAIKCANGSFYYKPSFFELKSQWVNEVSRISSRLLRQVKITQSRSNAVDLSNVSFEDMLTEIQPVLNAFFEELMTVDDFTNDHLQKWKSLEYLWTLNEPDFISNIGTDLTATLNFVNTVYNERKKMSLFPFTISFESIIIIDQEQAVLLTLAKLDQWQDFGLKILISLYKTEAIDFHHKFVIHRKFVEESQFSMGSLKTVAALVNHLEKIRIDIDRYTNLFPILKETQRLLLHSHIHIPPDFIYCEQLRADHDTLRDIHSKKEHLITSNRENISSTLDKEVGRLRSVCSSLSASWKERKPTGLNDDPNGALETISTFEQSINDAKDQIDDLQKVAKVLLIPIVFPNRLDDLLKDVAGYKNTWSSVNGVWKAMHAIVEQPWSSVHVDILKEKLQNELNGFDSLASSLFQFPVFQNIIQSIQSILSVIKTLEDLKAASLKKTHWSTLFSSLSEISVTDSDLSSESFSLMDVLSLNLTLNCREVYEVINQAKDERLLASSLSEMTLNWKEAKFESFQHDSGLNLISNWNSLSTLTSDDINLLLSMKNSPFFETFEQQIYEMESKLTDMTKVLSWGLDIQKQWCYLFGVLNEKSTLSKLLGAEGTKFRSLSTDLTFLFATLLRANSALDVLHNSDYLQALHSLLESLKRVRKSLNDFLESQRELFPRFYFLGNEDLLHLIGSNKDHIFIANQMNKLFGAIGGLKVIDDMIVSVSSTEGEPLTLKKPVSLSPEIPTTQWMGALETEIKHTLMCLIHECHQKFSFQNLPHLFNAFPFQVLWVCLLVHWTERTELKENEELICLEQEIVVVAETLCAERIESHELYKTNKVDSLVSEMYSLKKLIEELKQAENRIVVWNQTQKFYFSSDSDSQSSVSIIQGGIETHYGFEYVGVPEALVQTPTVQELFATMLHALSHKLGGSPFGPAGTGKTESIKYLGKRLGRFVLVFNCDDNFEYRSMARILMGVAQIGAWGCFDEFNRLKEASLSAVSTLIEEIQLSLLKNAKEINLLERRGELHKHTGIFITMNLGYAGRSQLPGNLKRMFREFSMAIPETALIAETLLSTMGIADSKNLATRVVAFMEELRLNMSEQTHYDFGLRAVRALIRNCRTRSINARSDSLIQSDDILQSMRDLVPPKLLDEDLRIFESLWKTHFPGYSHPEKGEQIKSLIQCFCEENGYVVSDAIYTKCYELFELQKTQQGIILVGEAGCGKSTILASTLHAVEHLTKVENITYTIESKAFSKDQLYGYLDPITFEWQDGIFSSILRDINEDILGDFKESNVWIIFDSDLDPTYAETLNSVLDDNKVFTLPNGERLHIPSNLHIVFEVKDLTYATPATVSRCGMLWVNQDMVNTRELLLSICKRELSALSLESAWLSKVEKDIFRNCEIFFSVENFELLSHESKNLSHVMKYDVVRISKTFSKLLGGDCMLHADNLAMLNVNAFSLFSFRHIALCAIWSFAGDCPLEEKVQFAELIGKLLLNFDRSVIEGTLLDYELCYSTGSLLPLSCRMKEHDLEAHQVISPDLVISTPDTYRHELILFTLLKQGQPLILCGPPGSGKTMTLQNALKRSADHELIGMNFSKEVTVDSILKTIEQYASYKMSSEGLILQPLSYGKQLVLFCDEINLPKKDQYGTQQVILFLRQLLEKGGFWTASENKWVTLRNIQIVAACNPSTDPGRTEMTERFTRHTSIIMVDYPGKDSLLRIYRTFFSAVFKLCPRDSDNANRFAQASVDLYLHYKQKFTTQSQPHYIVSPRELTRLIRGIYHALNTAETTDLRKLITIWTHESRRVFADRLVCAAEREWFDACLTETIVALFPNPELKLLSEKQVFFSDWLSSSYQEVDIEKVKSFISERLKTFCEEVLSTDVILHEEMVFTMLNVDRVLKQTQGHAMLIAPSGSGKKTITRFVAWLNNIEVMIPNIHRKYLLKDFDEFLKKALTQCAVEDSKICVILDESSMVEASFIERLNTLLANSDIPGLFQGEDFENLLSKLKSSPYLPNTVLDDDQSMYEWFTGQVAKNLHVIFNIDDPKHSSSAKVMTSPALFNRCILIWMGEWTNSSLSSVAGYIIHKLPIDDSYSNENPSTSTHIKEQRQNVSNIFCQTFKDYFLETVGNSGFASTFIDALRLLKRVFEQTSKEIDDNQRFVRNGLFKLKETLLTVKKLSKELAEKRDILHAKELEARRTLDRMLMDQNEAERKQEASVEIRKILILQEQEITKRRDSVMADLASAEPAILDAQRGVKNIKKQQLTELRSMINPPEAVKVTLEAVCVILGFQIESWKDIQHTVRRDDFIARIVTFDTEKQLDEDLRGYMESNYLSRPTFKYENVLRASQACGPLYQWVVAQLQFSNILMKVEPLQRDLKVLENEIIKTKAKSIAADEMITELEEHIELSKESYSSIIRDVEMLKNEMASVESKVSKSSQLLESLNSEKTRWSADIERFLDLKKNLLGNCILKTLYLSYCFSHDFKTRRKLVQTWKEILNSLQIAYDTSFNDLAAEVSPQEQANWVNNGLDDDCFAIETFYGVLNPQLPRYPIVIDPDGKLLDVMSAIYGQKLIISSFLDDNFSKVLENTLRFGGVLLIQDSEFFDPLIMKVLAQEFQIVGGRKSIAIGDATREIDVSRDFSLLLYTRDRTWNIPDYVKTKVNIFNFTITKDNLETQTLQCVLTEKLPAVQTERKALLESSSSCKVKLDGLGHKLLELLNTSEGNLLENDSLLSTLERLKIDSRETSIEKRRIDQLISQQEALFQEYTPISMLAVKIFELLEWMAENKHWFYDVDVNEFLMIFQRLFAPSNHLIEGNGTEIERITLGLLRMMFYHFGGMFSESDSLIFASRLFELQLISTESFQTIQQWKTMRSDINMLRTITDVPTVLNEFKSGILTGDAKDGLFQMLLKFMHGEPWSMKFHCSNESSFQTMIVGCGKGVDGSLMIKQVASESNKKLVTIAMGSSESCAIAEKFLAECMENGDWMLLQNIQMSFTWCNEVLPKYLKMVNTNSNPEFRLFMTCSLQDRIHPGSQLLQNCTKITCEQESGVIHKVKRFWESICNTSVKESNVVIYIKHLICWIHALILERTRITGLSVEYHDLDFELAVAAATTSFTEETVDWVRLRFIVGRLIYSSRLDRHGTMYKWVAELTSSILSIDSLRTNSSIVGKVGSPTDKFTLEGISSWLNNLPWTAEEKDAWLSIPKEQLQKISLEEAQFCMSNLQLLDGALAD